MLAFQGAEQRAHMLAEHRKVKGEAPLNEQELAYACQSIRQDGYLREDSRQAYGVTDLSAPILGPSGHAIAVLTCPYMRRIDAHMAPSVDTVVEGVRETAAHLSMCRDETC